MLQWLIKIFLNDIIVIAIIYYYSAKQCEYFGIYSINFEAIIVSLSLEKRHFCSSKLIYKIPCVDTCGQMRPCLSLSEQWSG